MLLQADVDAANMQAGESQPIQPLRIVMASNHTYCCVKDRYVTKSQRPCPVCHEPLKDMGYCWRPPKKRKDAAWKRIQAGDIWWDKSVEVQWYRSYMPVQKSRRKGRILPQLVIYKRHP